MLKRTATTRRTRRHAAVAAATLLVAASSAAAATVTDRGMYRFETADDFSRFDGISIGDSGGKAYVDDYLAAQSLRASGVDDGEQLNWLFRDPDGDVYLDFTATYDLASDCWLAPGGSLCGNPSNPFLNNNVTWYVGVHPDRVQAGKPWTVDVSDDGRYLFGDDFEIVGYDLSIVSGNGQEGLIRSTLPSGLIVKLVDDTGAPVPGKRVDFVLGSSPNGAKGTGLATTFNDPPTGAETSALGVLTDAAGQAAAYLSLGSKAGAYQVDASAQSAATKPAFGATASSLAIGSVEMSGTGDVPLPGSGFSFFVGEFDASGNIVTLANDPVGAVVNRGFDLTISLDAHPVMPSFIPNTEWKWQIKSLGGPETGIPFAGFETTQPVVPQILAPQADDFGDRAMKISMTFKDDTGTRLGTQAVPLNLKLFYDRDGDDDADLLPNWFEYWEETSANLFRADRSKEVRYDPDGSHCGAKYGCYFCGYAVLYPSGVIAGSAFNNFVYVTDAATEPNDETGHTGIDTYAETLIHENAHLEYCRQWWFEPYGGYLVDPNWHQIPGVDTDGDQIPDSEEAGLDYDPLMADSDLDGISDWEDLARKNEHDWPAGSADAEDWAYPGKQSDPPNAAGRWPAGSLSSSEMSLLRQSDSLADRLRILHGLVSDPSLAGPERARALLDSLADEVARPLPPGARRVGYADAAEHVMSLTMNALTRMGAGAQPVLVDALPVARGEMRERILVMLGSMGDGSVLEEVRSILDEGSNGYLRARAAEALGAIGQASAIPDLVEALEEPWHVPTGQPGDLPFAVGGIYYPVRASAAAALERLGVRVVREGHTFRLADPSRSRTLDPRDPGTQDPPPAEALLGISN